MEITTILMSLGTTTTPQKIIATTTTTTTTATATATTTTKVEERANHEPETPLTNEFHEGRFYGEETIFL